MAAEPFTEGVTPEMVRIGLIQRDVENLIHTAHGISRALDEALWEMAPADTTGDAPVDRTNEFWEGFTADVDQAEQAREAAGDG